MNKTFSILAFCLCLHVNSQITDTIGNTIIKMDSLIGFTNQAQNWPWDVEWGPDNSLWYTVGDKVCRFDTSTQTIHTVLNRPDTTSNTMSIAFHPNFISNPVVYVTVDVGNYYYSYSGGPIVLYKYDYSVSGDSLYNETSILSWTHPGEHCGGRLHMGNDNYLYCTTSEYSFANDIPGDLHGRVLRINLDGSIPVINITGEYSISKGHRNPQGIVQVPNGNIIISEFGQIIDELNLIQEGGNYGWPATDGDNCFYPDSCNSPTFSYISPIDTAMRPPSGITYYNHIAIPELNGCILQSILSFGGVQGGLVASKLNATMDDVISDVHYFKGQFGRWRDVTVSPDGKVYAIIHDRQIPEIVVIYNPEYHVGIEETNENGFLLYPNPAGNILHISGFHAIQDWEIVTSTGARIMAGSNNEIEIQINIANLNAGMYFFKTFNGNQKFIKQ